MVAMNSNSSPDEHIWEQSIKARLRTKTAVYESSEKFKILQELEDGYIETDLDLKLYFVNPSFCKIIGYSLEELMKIDPATFADTFFFDPAAAKSFYDAYQRARATGAPQRLAPETHRP